MNPPLVLAVVDCLLVLGASLLLGVGLSTKSTVLKFWSAAYLSAAAGLSLFALTIKTVPWLGYGVGASLILMAYGLMWSGIRSLSPTRPQHRWVFLVGLLWACVSPLHPLVHGAFPRLSAFGLIGAIFMLALAREFLRVESNRFAKLSLVALAAIHATFYLTRSVCVFLVPTRPMQLLWVHISGVEGIFFIFCDAFLIMNLVRSVHEQELASAAHFDFLTGVLTRRRFVELADRLLAKTTCTLLILDVDHFKQLNDSFGHAEGDKVLKELGRICRENVRKTDLVGRLGGDEFLILLEEPENVARVVAARIQTTFSAICKDRGWSTGVSIGLAAGEAGQALNTLLVIADTYLYEVKAHRIKKHPTST